MLKELISLDVSEEIEEMDKKEEKLKPIFDEMEETINRENLLGITAPQIGHNLRIIAMKFSDGIQFFINPLITKSSDFKIVKEKCLGYNDTNKCYLVPRFEKIEFGYQTKKGTIMQCTFTKEASYVFQQFEKLLDGVTLDAYGYEINEEKFDKLSDDDKQKVLQDYYDELMGLEKEVTSEIDADPVLHDQLRQLQFLESVYSGETKLASPKPNRETRRKQRKEAKKFQTKVRLGKIK